MSSGECVFLSLRGETTKRVISGSRSATDRRVGDCGDYEQARTPPPPTSPPLRGTPKSPVTKTPTATPKVASTKNFASHLLSHLFTHYDSIIDTFSVDKREVEKCVAQIFVSTAFRVGKCRFCVVCVANTRRVIWSEWRLAKQSFSRSSHSLHIIGVADSQHTRFRGKKLNYAATLLKAYRMPTTLHLCVSAGEKIKEER